MQITAAGGAKPPEDQIDEAARTGMEMMTSPWFRGFLKNDPREALGRVRVPVLSLFGELDLQVEPEQNLPATRKALQAAGNEDVTLRELEGLNHLLQRAGTGLPAEYYTIEETMNPVALSAVRNWILDRFGPPKE